MNAVELQVYEHRPAWQILPLLEDLYRRFPGWRDHEPHEAQAALWSLHYADGLLPEEEIRAALLVLRALDPANPSYVQPTYVKPVLCPNLLPPLHKKLSTPDERSTVIDVPMTAPTTNGDRPVPRSTGPKGLLPSTWFDRSLRVEHVVGGAVRTTSGILADLYPAGPILIVGGCRTLIAWETLATVELVSD